jgi:hypothetical protein
MQALARWALLLLAACGSSDGLDNYLPPLPDPTGEAQEVFAGAITQDRAAELLRGPAATGMVGDYFIRNDRAAFIVSAATRVIGVVPQGGNLVDASLRAGGGQRGDDHFGELSLIYLLGRTCEHTRVEVVRDGARGGVAVLRATGKSGNNDYINLKGIGFLPVDTDVDPEIDDGVDCATTYVLAPGATALEVYFSLYNPRSYDIDGPMGTLADTGGEVESWGNGRGFERTSATSFGSFVDEAPIDYVVYQGPGIAYGIVPRHDTPTVHTAFLVAGVSVFLLGNDSLLEILNRDLYHLHLPAGGGALQKFEFVVGEDAAAIDRHFRVGEGQTLSPVAGTVRWSSGLPAVGARVGVYQDAGGDGAIGEDDRIVSYLDVGSDGRFSGEIPATGNLLLRAEVKDQGRSQAAAAEVQVDLEIPEPIVVDLSIVDDATSMNVPARILVIGDHLAFPDSRLFEVYDRVPGVVQSRHLKFGTTVDLGAGSDPPLLLPAGATYRLFATRGTEWSAASALVTGSGPVDLELRLRQVAPATGYLATEWHVHHLASPDSPVGRDERIRSALSAGIEMFAITDHDFVADLQPILEEEGLSDRLRIIPGIEVTPFVYGHFNAWPLVPDDLSPDRGAIDWARGDNGFAMTPGQIYAAARARGAQMIQVNHPRASGIDFQAFFDRANLQYDYDLRSIYGDFENAPIPNAWLRLPGESLWDDSFNALEVWNGFSMGDTDGDGRREVTKMDRMLRDWFNLLSMGLVVTPTGNSDTHTSAIDPVGMPRTYVRVSDDGGFGLSSGAAVDEVLSRMTGESARDIVVSNGPMIDVRAGGLPALGAVVTASGGRVNLQVSVVAPEWAEIDTLEVFANATPESPAPDDLTALVPMQCWTSRDLSSLNSFDPCVGAGMAAAPLVINREALGGGYARFFGTIAIEIDAADIPTRPGGSGQDAWLVFRVRGDRAIFPLLPQGAIDEMTLPVILTGTDDEREAVLRGKGVSAAAFSAPVFVDFDGGGYRAPFAP